MTTTNRSYVTSDSLARTLRFLKLLPGRIGRGALKKGVAKAGSQTVKDLKAAAPRGRTGLFKKSMAKKDIAYPQKLIYQSIAGQRRSKLYTAKQIASANRKTGRISKGLSGRGLAPQIHLVDSLVRPHLIAASKTGRGKMFWNIGKGNVKLNPMRAGRIVRHPGSPGTGFVRQVYVAGNSARMRIIQREVQAELGRRGF